MHYFLFCLVTLFSYTAHAATPAPKTHWSQENWDDSKEEEPSSHPTVKTKNSSHREVTPFSPGSNNLALDLGQIFLLGDLNRYSDSLGMQIHYTYGVSDLLAFDTSFNYSQHSKGDLTLFGLLTGIRLNLTNYDKIIPHFIAGLGFYLPSYVDRTMPSSPLQTSNHSISSVLFGLHLGPGVNLLLNKNMFFGASLILHHMFGTDAVWKNDVPFRMGGAYVSFLVQLGTTF